MTDDALGACRARIAAVQVPTLAPEALGTITLRLHQRRAVTLVSGILDAHRGCLLADDVGRGKTFVALAVAKRWRRPLVVIPAALRDTWERAMVRAGVRYALLSHEALSRGAQPPFEPDGIVVDESHHFRNPGTYRFAALAAIGARAELLLMSATPVQNAMADLATQLALVLGAAAHRVDAGQLARLVARVDSPDEDAGLPAVAPPEWIHPPADDAEVLDAVLNLPPPPRALDAGDAGALRVVTLVRAWASSRAALAAMVARRRRTAAALEQALDAGRTPTRAELRSWHCAEDDTVQLGFAPLLAARDVAVGDTAALRDVIRAEHAALRHLARLLRGQPDPDAARAESLVRIARAQEGARVVAFASFAATAEAYHRALRALPGVGLLTAAGARIASGRITRRELLARFAPLAHGFAEPPARERVSLLLCTDLLSEGVNLQDARVVVHLDLPWNPARLAQRVGRVRRPDGASRVFSYLVAPPAGTELLLDVEHRLRHKLAAAERLLGRGADVLPVLAPGAAGCEPASKGAAAHHGALIRRLERWSPEGAVAKLPSPPLIAAADSTGQGWLAMTADGRLMARIDGLIGDDMALLDRATDAACARNRALNMDDRRHALDDARAEVARRRALAGCGTSELASDIARRTERRLARLLRDAPRAQRASLASAAIPLRQRLARPLPLGAERALESLLRERAMPPEVWIARASFLMPPLPRHEVRADHDDGLAVVIVLGPGA